MEKRAKKTEEREGEAGLVDLSALRDFDFTENWSESTGLASGGREDRAGDYPAVRKDRRPDRRQGKANRPPSSRGGEHGPPFDQRNRSHRPDSFPGGRSPRPDGSGHRWERGGDGGPKGKGRFSGHDRIDPRDSPFDIQIQPEEAIFATLAKAIRQSLRTYELFEIARLILEKPDRYQLAIRFRASDDNASSTGLLHQSVPDQIPFLSEDAAVDHVLRHHLPSFFRTEDVEVDPPKGNFQFVCRCSLNGEVIGPPNYHRYPAFLVKYHMERFPHMSFERFKGHLETVRDEEAIKQWLESMRRETRYHPLQSKEENPPALHSLDQARNYLLEHLKDQVVRSGKALHFHGSAIKAITDDGIRPFVFAFVESQKRFPLETANGMRGRLRRMNFFIYKRGSHGVTYVCAVKRKFREPGQQFSDSVQSLITFLENNPSIHGSELPEKFLGLKLPHKPTSGESGITIPPTDSEEKQRLDRMAMDLRWLLSEGYVVEFSDGRLHVHPEVSPGGRGDAPHDHGETSDPAPEPGPSETLPSPSPLEEEEIPAKPSAEAPPSGGEEPPRDENNSDDQELRLPHPGSDAVKNEKDGDSSSEAGAAAEETPERGKPEEEGKPSPPGA